MGCSGVLMRSNGIRAAAMAPRFSSSGRRGAGSTLRVADFRTQTGIYILYGDYGPYYVGLTRTSMGKRLKDHLTDKHDGKWQRFSWFGFANVLQQRDAVRAAAAEATEAHDRNTQ